MDGTIIIKEPVVVLVEGKDEELFLPEFLTARKLPQVQFLPYGGKEKLGVYLRTLIITPGFDTVRSVGVVRDADSDCTAAFKSVVYALKNAKLPAPTNELVVHNGPPRTAVFIAPGNGQPGELEDCLLASVNDRPALPCINTLVDCIETATKKNISKRSKAKVWTFLATQEKPMNGISVGARAGVWPMAHAAFDGLAQLIELLSA